MVSWANDQSVEAAYPEYQTEQEWRDGTLEVLEQACHDMFHKPGPPGFIGGNKKQGVTK